MSATVASRAWEKKRRYRRRDVRKTTIGIRQLTRRAVALTHEEPVEHWRPTVRGECLRVPRPCPFVSCKWNLYLDVQPNGSIVLNFPDAEPDELGHSCALDVAELGGMTLDELGPAMNLTRERIRQIEDRLLVRLRLSRESQECRP